MTKEYILLRLGTNAERPKHWDMIFENNTHRTYSILPMFIFPTKKRDKIRYVLEKGIKDEVRVYGEYRRDNSWLKGHSALFLSKEVCKFRMDIWLDGKDTKKDTEMKIDKERVESKFLKVEDLSDTVETVTLDRAEMFDVTKDGHPDSQEGIYFEEYEKPLLLNVTNLRALYNEWGEDTEDWRGKKVYLQIVPTTNPQTRQATKGIRIAIPTKKA